MTRVVVTGGAGFIGSSLTRFLRDQDGVQVLATDIVDAVGVVRVDLLDEPRLIQVIGDFRPNVVLHAGARTDLVGQGIADYRANTDGTRNVIRAAVASGAARIIILSSRLVMKLGETPRHLDDYSGDTAYGISKMLTEGIAWDRRISSSVETCIVRPTSIWGPGFGVPYRNFFDSVRRGHYVHPIGAEIWKEFGYIENAVRQLWWLVNTAENIDQRTYWLSDAALELGRFADLIAADAGVRRPRRVPVAVLHAMARAGDLLASVGAPSPLTSFRLKNLLTPMSYVGDRPQIADVVGVNIAVQRTNEWLDSEQ